MSLYMPLFRSCTTKQALLQIHARLQITGSNHDALMATKLIESYAKMGAIEAARLVFDNFSRPDSFMWVVMIKSYVRTSHFREALAEYHYMQCQQLQMISYIFPPILSACSGLFDVPLGRKIHGRIIKGGFEHDAAVETSLLQMYSGGGSFDDARHVFDEMPTRDVVAWSSMISSCIHYGKADIGLEIFSTMLSKSIEPDAIVMMQVAQACADLGSLVQAKSIHGYIIKTGIDESLVNSLVLMYGECGALEIGEKVFATASRMSIVTCTAMISCYNRRSRFREAMRVHAKMQELEIDPNSVTLIALLHSCAQLRFLREGRSVHGFSLKRRIDPNRNHIGSAVINFYSIFGRLENCYNVFDAIHEKTLDLWNSLIAACAQNGSSEEALRLLIQMRNQGFIPDSFTLTSSLQSIGHISDFNLGAQIHCHSSKSGFQFNGYVQNSLLDMYCRSGSSETAYRVFLEIEGKDVVTWNSMITGFSHDGKPEAAIEVFDRMIEKDLELDEVTFLSAIQAVSHLGSLEKGRCIHHRLITSGLKDTTCIYTALTSMYSKCGDIEMARRVFDSISEKNVMSWSTMISGYRTHGLVDEAIMLFSQMVESGIRPSEVTFLSILSACSHSGLVKEGIYYFDLMKREFGIDPQFEHCACMVDLLSRTGQIDAAFNLIQSMEPSASIWRALLNGCNIHQRNHIIR